MALSEPDLWAVIRDWPFPYRRERDEQSEPPRTCTRFEHNLRMIGDWTDEASERITEAYRKFLYLKALTGEVLTPPRWVDEAWHLHQSFPIDYAALEAATGRRLVHQTRIGRRQAQAAYRKCYAMLEQEFGASPDAVVWPSPARLREIGRCMMAIAFGVVLLGGAVLSVAPNSGFQVVLLLSGGLMVFFGFLILGSMQPPKVAKCG